MTPDPSRRTASSVKQGIRARVMNPWLDAVAGQFERPHGLLGRTVVAWLLDRGNRDMVRRAVDALELRRGDAGADVGFGGGAGLSMLLDAVGPHGAVYGCDVSVDMVRRARAVFANEIAMGQVTVERHVAAIADQSCDGVISVNTIYFVSDLSRFMSNLRRITRPGGRVVIGIGSPDAMRSMPFTRTRFRIRELPEIQAHADAAGLHLLEVAPEGQGMTGTLMLVFSA